MKDILSISGYSGLFRYISQARNGMIVEALGTGKRMNAFATMKVNSLKDIAIFTRDKEVTLEEVFRKIFEKESGGSALDSKSEPDTLKSYFSEVLPDYNEDRVYVSDIRKVLSWYNILHGLNILSFEKDKVVKEESQPVKKKKTDTRKKT
ncbi:MAG: hypothetical protein AMS27_07450 [Bacteroides sp. SM23_62_1]|nr:MAG: hypothetical protein AMS27_07450 [Bacteroides sp. SM23_62_1]